ncbi:MAG: hypothetical protein NT150_04375 [Bacteroidetes bacterium]|nr:hypothetical protein [Bacteroidota bacterium]
MKKIIPALLFCFASSLSYAQVIGVGLGNGGLNIKSDPEKRLGLIGRVGLGTGNNWYTVSPNISGIMRVFTSDNAKPYFGIGMGTSFTHTNTSNSVAYNTFIPIGVEVFPLGNKRMSVTVESGVGMSSFNNSFFYSGFRGLLEFTFYVGSQK